MEEAQKARQGATAGCSADTVAECGRCGEEPVANDTSQLVNLSQRLPG
jgi:hypothetical protein